MELLAVSGFSKVYKVRWQGRVYAFKALTSTHTREPGHLFLREVRNLLYANRNISDEDVIKLEFVTWPLLGLGFPYCDGGCLRHFLGRVGLAHFERLLFARAIATSLASLHFLGIIHRDVTSENILVMTTEENRWTPILADLGLSRLRESSLSHQMTPRMGNLRWRAPEVSANQPYSFSADVFSLSLVFWELFTGHIPFQALPNAAPRDVAQQISAGSRPDALQVADPALRALLEAMWSHKPSKRPTMLSAKAQLDKFILNAAHKSPSASMAAGSSRGSDRVVSAEKQLIWNVYGQQDLQQRASRRLSSRSKSGQQLSFSTGQPISHLSVTSPSPSKAVKIARDNRRKYKTERRVSGNDTKHNNRKRQTPNETSWVPER